MKIIRKFCALALAALMTFPTYCQTVTAEPQPDVSAVAAVVIEAESRRVVYEKNAYERRPMASTTKIMSTLIALEQDNLEEYFTVDSNAIKVEGSSMGLKDGDRVSLRALCYGMMLPSGNDAANSTAVRIAGSVEKFAVMMNEKASELGLKDTNFVTPSGLDDYTDDHYSTAYDMACLTAKALENPEFVEICSSKNAQLEYGNPPYKRWLSNNNKLLNMCDGVFGVKTGFTDKARRCLVSACERDGVKLICVTLNAPDDWNDHSKLYDYAFSQVKSYSMPYEFGGITANVVGGEEETVLTKMSETPTASLFQDELGKVKTEVIMPAFHYAPVISGEELGTVNFYLDGRLIESVPLVASRDVPVKETEEQSTVKRFINKIKNFTEKL